MEMHKIVAAAKSVDAVMNRVFDGAVANARDEVIKTKILCWYFVNKPNNLTAKGRAELERMTL